MMCEVGMEEVDDVRGGSRGVENVRKSREWPGIGGQYCINELTHGLLSFIKVPDKV